MEVYPDLVWVWTAFWRMHACRPEGMNGALRIPVSEIAAYAAIHGYGQLKARDLFLFIGAMDESYMGYVRERRAEEEAKKPKTQNNQTPPPRR